MVLKTFNVKDDVYSKFSMYCKENGISMSKQVSDFMEFVVTDEPTAKTEYLKKLQKIRKGKFFQIKDFSEEYEKMKQLYISRKELQNLLSGDEVLIHSKDSKGWHIEAFLLLDEIEE